MNYLKLMRIKHYIKNLLIFIPLIFSKNILQKDNFFNTLVGFVIFSLTSSIIYIINDLKDVDKDKQHPIKCKRPLASGKVTKKEAYILIIILFLIIFSLCFIFSFNIYSIFTILIYLLLNITYSYGLKNFPILDVIILVIGFMLRIIFGALICEIEVSNWLYLTVMAFAFFMGFGKRRNEMKKVKENSRNVLKYYNYEFLDKSINMFLTLFITFYSLWSMNIESRYMIFTTILVIAIVLKYSLNLEQDSYGDPVDMLLNDYLLIGMCILYILIVFILLY